MCVNVLYFNGGMNHGTGETLALVRSAANMKVFRWVTFQQNDLDTISNIQTYNKIPMIETCNLILHTSCKLKQITQLLSNFLCPLKTT